MKPDGSSAPAPALPILDIPREVLRDALGSARALFEETPRTPRSSPRRLYRSGRGRVGITRRSRRSRHLAARESRGGRRGRGTYGGNESLLVGRRVTRVFSYTAGAPAARGAHGHRPTQQDRARVAVAVLGEAVVVAVLGGRERTSSASPDTPYGADDGGSRERLPRRRPLAEERVCQRLEVWPFAPADSPG